MGVRNSIKRLFGAQLYNSTDGVVLSNLGSSARFAPTEQVRGITYKAIDKIGQRVSAYKPIVLNVKEQPLTQHALLDLWRKPNPHTRGADFIHLFGMLYEIYGETFWYLAKGESTKRVKEIYLLNPGQVELKVEEGELVGYILHKQSGGQVPLMLDEVIHDKRPNPFNPWRGMSVIERASEYIDTEIVTTRFTLNYLKNNASPSGIVSLPNMAQETFMQFAAQWRENYEGPQNAGKTAFIRGEQAKFQAVGATLKDIDAKLIKDMSKEDVLMMLDMPKALLGISEGEGLGRSAVETHNYIFAESKLEPMFLRLDDIYEEIANISDPSHRVNVTHESPVPKDKDFEQRRLKELTNVAITVNEARAQLGLEPLKDPQFDTVKPLQLVQDEQTSSKAATVVRVVKKKSLSKSQLLKKQDSEREAFRKKLTATSETYAKEIKRTIATFMGKQEAVVLTNLSKLSKTYEEISPSLKEESEELARLLLPLIVELMDEQAQDTANFITGEPIVITTELKREITSKLEQSAGTFNKDTYTALERTINEGVTQGESLEKLKKRVEQVYADAKGYRAERIARTESSRASNHSAELVYGQSGYNEVEWFINPGACEFCRTFSGRRKSIGGKYNNIGDVVTGDEGGMLKIDYSDIETPPLHPNCTCSLVPV